MTVYYIITYLCECLILFNFNENSFSRKTAPDWSKYRTPLSYVILFLISFGMSFFQIPFFNLLTFVAVTFFVTFFAYKVKVRQAIYVTAVLTLCMFVTEILVMMFSNAVLLVPVTSYLEDPTVFIYQALFSKLLYFFSSFCVMKMFFEKKYNQETDKYLIGLAVLPVTTIFMFLYLFMLIREYNMSMHLKYGFIIGALILLIANIIVFYIYSLIQKTNCRITELTLESQKEKSTLEYYEMMLAKQENYSVLVHDIKRHLINIETLAQNEDCTRITNYIDSVRDNFGLSEKVVFSGNKLIDVIINRYNSMFAGDGISFQVSISCSLDEIFEEIQIATLLDNMLENAYESAKKSENPFVQFTVNVENSHFLVIETENSCDETPVFKNKIPVTTKKGKNHGIGTKSMKKTAVSLGGEIRWFYDGERKTFITRVLFRI